MSPIIWEKGDFGCSMTLKHRVEYFEEEKISWYFISVICVEQIFVVHNFLWFSWTGIQTFKLRNEYLLGHTSSPGHFFANLSVAMDTCGQKKQWVMQLHRQWLNAYIDFEGGIEGNLYHNHHHHHLPDCQTFGFVTKPILIQNHPWK